MKNPPKKTKRYKGIDAFRGLCMIMMVGGHMLNWWLTPEDYWLYLFLESIFAPIGASGFLFASGMSTALSYNNNLTNAKNSNEYSSQFIRNVYMFRALLLLLIAFIYNLAIAIAIMDFKMIWAWFVLQTIAFSLIMTWPLLKTSKLIRIIFGVVLAIVNQYILIFLLPYQGQANFYGLLYHILFNPLDQYPILFYFTILLLGTVVGDIVFDLNLIDNQNERRNAFKKKFILPLFIVGAISTIFGILFLFPIFLVRTTLSSYIYSIGIILTVISVLIGLEEFEFIKVKKSYRFFYYYSYYSFTIFLAHNPLYFLFYQQLNVINVWFAIIIALIFITILLRFIYKKCGPKASLKILISAISFKLTMKIEERKKK